MKKKHQLLQKKCLLKFPQAVIMTGFLLLFICTITGCGSDSGQQAVPFAAEPIQRENPVSEEPAQTEPTQEEAKQEATEQAVPSQPVSEKEASEAETAAPSSDEASSSPSYFGIWEITSSISGAYSALSEEDCTALVGIRFEYFTDYAIYDDGHRLESPQYFESTQTADDFSAVYKGMSLEKLGISEDSVQVAAIENASGIGDTFYIKDENTLIIPWDGVFFEAQRISADS